jgi:putative PIN family toxin of toxin-antitoxin system
MKPLQLVMDTSVLIAGLRSKRGASQAVLRLLNDPRIKFHVSNALLFEYEEVLRREQAALGLTDEDIENVLDGFCALTEKHYRLFVLRPTSRDPDDDFLVDLAVSAGVDYLVTHNTCDLHPVERYGIKVVTPKQVLEKLKAAT